MTTEELQSIEGFTPGPLAQSRDAVPDWYVQITVYHESTGKRVATAFEHKANANLIQAAPKLLAERNALLQALRETVPMVEHFNDRYGCKDVRKKVYEVINLAES
jgi:hypothetical protein